MKTNLFKRHILRAGGILICSCVSVAQTGWIETAWAQTQSSEGTDIAQKADEQGPVSFQDIFDNPDDPALNLAFARQQAAKGQLKDAVATLERMLILHPNWDSARLFYAITLHQLDDDQAAAREFDILRTRSLPPEQMAIVERYHAKDDPDPVSLLDGEFDGRLSVSGRYDDNVGGVFADIVFGNQDAGDHSITLAGQLRYQVPVTASGNVLGYISGRGQMRRHDDISASDFNVYGAEIGLRGQYDRWQWAGSLNAQSIEIDGEGYNQSLGFDAMMGYDFLPSVTLSTIARYRDEDYDPIPNAPSATERTGDRFNIGAGLSFRPIATFRADFEATYQTVSARQDDLAYDGARFGTALRYDFHPSVYGRASGVLRTLHYKADSPFLFPAAPRRDDFLNGRIALGMRPALWMGPDAQSSLFDRVSIEFGVNHTERTTNIPGADFKNSGVELRLIYDF